MKIAVIIPTLHRPNDLHKTLESILSNSKLVEQIIIVDQSDTKDTSVMLKKFANESISYFHTNSKSSAQARNTGIAKVSANIDLVVFLDDDVTLDPHAFEHISFSMQKNTACL
jgi:glycosyltransferase involved in cell wall biosynthesis